ncbi:MAG: dihydropteroate synthase [Cystobacterineae bacterium]|nr:dihydropteroate synthase [Cystobacterineae bacterium]
MDNPLPVLLSKERSWRWPSKPTLMGIINLTANSFSQDGFAEHINLAVAYAQKLLHEGADWIDMGAESTHPGAKPVEESIEKKRILTAVHAFRAQNKNAFLSIDTMKASVAREALLAGADLINDVSGMLADTDMPQVLASQKAAICIGHMPGTPQTMQAQLMEGNIVEELLGFFSRRIEVAMEAGIPRESILIDPCIGFGKSFKQNWLLLQNLPRFRVLNVRVAVGFSRKAFLGELAHAPRPSDRDQATAAIVAVLAAQSAADLIRVHNIALAKTALEAGTQLASQPLPA